MLTLLLFILCTIMNIRGESIVSIASGTNFSSCTGYCYYSININAWTITTLQSSKTNSDDYPDIQQQYSIDSSVFNQLVQLVGNIQLWKSVDSPIGCPDCDHQGSEWIDVYTSEQPNYRVTFEYNSTIPGYESLVNSLSQIREQYFSN